MLLPSLLSSLLPMPPTARLQVRASVVYCPEQAPQGKHLFAYSIRFSLQDAATQLAALPPGASVVQTVSRCQLMSRHWVIRDERGEVADEVRAGRGGMAWPGVCSGLRKWQNGVRGCAWSGRNANTCVMCRSPLRQHR